MRPLALLFCALAAACTASPSPPAPEFWPLEKLVDVAASGGPYLADSQGRTIVPMSAVVTPPGGEIFFESPPFAPEPTTNELAGPRLNLLPGLSEGRFTPYVTVELWLHDFGPIWVQPLYTFVRGDGHGHPALDANGKVEPVGKPVFGAYVDHRFYSPFWRIEYVVVPDQDLARMGTDAQPKSVRDVLDTGWPIQKGPLGLCPEVPDDLTLDPAIDQAQSSPRPLPKNVWAAALQAEYTAAGLGKMSALQVAKLGGWWEGEAISYLGFGGGYYVELPDETVESAPIFIWVDRDVAGNVTPLGLPNIGGHAPLFSGRPLTVANGRMDHSALWDATMVVRPAGAEPFFPADFAALKDAYAASHPADADRLEVSVDVNAQPYVDRYAGRLARHPSCFQATAIADVTTWAKSCDFLDSQDAIESQVNHDEFIDAKTRVLCPILLWSTEVNE